MRIGLSAAPAGILGSCPLGFDGCVGNVQALGDFLDAEALDVAHFENTAALCRQFVDGTENLFVHFGFRLAQEIGVFFVERNVQLALNFRADASLLDVVEGFVVHALI